MALANSPENTDLSPGEVLRYVRKALSMSQEDFAHLIGVTRTQVHRWEMGHRRMPRSGRLHIREVLLRPMLRMRIWRHEDVDRLAIRAGLVEPIKTYARTYVQGARVLLSEGFAAELAELSDAA